MAKKKDENSVFEIVVVLAIVFIVAFTGQILIHYENIGSPSFGGGSPITGFVAGGANELATSDLMDIGVSDIEVNPPSPLLGEPFEIRVTVINEGSLASNTPFYVQVDLIPAGEYAAPTVLNAPVTMSLEPGKATAVSFKIGLIAREGPVKIIATADSTNKLDDNNPSNNQRSKTIIITGQ